MCTLVETSLQLFPGLPLSTGRQYIVRFFAVARPNGSFSTPFLGSWSEGNVPTISGVLTTPPKHLWPTGRKRNKVSRACDAPLVCAH